jgi:hypothetical protein
MWTKDVCEERITLVTAVESDFLSEKAGRDADSDA